MGIKLVPGGQSSFFAMLNLLVHMFMYFYYFAAALGPNSPLQRFMWMKRYITRVQIIQFIMIVIQSVGLVVGKCDYPLFTAYLSGVSAAVFLMLFANFYIHTYLKEKRRKSCE